MIATLLDSPIGQLQIVASEHGLTAIEFEGRHSPAIPQHSEHPLLRAAQQQLSAYFAGQRHDFELDLAAHGTPFQQEVWAALREIPYGQQCSYRDIALKIGRERAVRAVGAANGRNPLPVIVPCHRVLGSDGSLTGFAGGLDIKRWLLEREGWQASP